MKFLKFATIVLLFFSLPISAAIINVDSSATGCTLHDAIRAANADAARGNCSAGSGADLIIVPTFTTVVLSGSLPDINTPITIRTPAGSTGKYTIDADGTLRTSNGVFLDPNNFNIFRIIDVNNVSLQNLVLKNSVLDTINLPLTGGAGLYIYNSEVTLSQVEITNNFIKEGTRIGAGVRILNNSTVNFEECTISDNELVIPDLGGQSRGGNIAVFDSTVTINNSTVLGVKDTTDGIVIVSSTAKKGAGIYLDNSNLNLTKSYFEYHKLEDQSAPGVDLYAINNSTVDVENSTFFHNRDESAVTGARIYLENSQMTLNNVTLWGNYYGGGLELVNSTISATNNLFPIIQKDNYTGDFCKAYNSLGNVITFNFQPEINNLTNFDDTSCGVSLVDFGASINTINLAFPESNGGPTKTSRLKFNPNGNDAFAINTGDTATCAATDQRDFPRLGNCDIGAYEFNERTDFAIDMSIVTSAPYYKGQRIEYAIDISNLGLGDAYGVQVLINVSGLSIDSWQTNHSCTLLNNDLSCTISSLANNGNTIIRVFATKDATPNFDGVATVGDYADYSQDTNTGNNIDNTGNSGTTVPAANLKVTQTLLTSPPYFISQTVNYQVTVENLGPNTANNIQLAHTLKDLNNGAYTGCLSSTATTCNIGSLNNTQTRTVNYSANISGTIVKSIVTVAADEYDYRIPNNTAKNKNTVSTNAELKIGGSISPSAPYYDEDFVNFNYSILNSGPDTATNIEVDFAPSFGNLFLVGVNGACSTLPCTIASLDSGNTVTVNFQAQILFPGQFFADMTALADQTDDDLGNNSVTITKTASPAVNLSVSLNLLDAPPFYVGNTITFEAKINNSLGADNTATSVLIDTPIVDNLSIIQVNSPNCVTLPCTLDNLDFGSNNQEVITIYARVLTAGNFIYQLRAYAAEHEVATYNNESGITATAINIPQELIFSDGFE